MKTMAAIGIRQYEQAVDSVALYADTIQAGLQMVLQRDRTASSSLLDLSPGGRLGMIVFGSDQGMCGQFNRRVADFAEELLQRDVQAGAASPVLVVVGSRILGPLRDSGWEIASQTGAARSVSGVTPLVQWLVLEIEQNILS